MFEKWKKKDPDMKEVKKEKIPKCVFSNEWIECDDHMPEENQRVIVMWRGNISGEPFELYSCIYNKREGFWSSDFDVSGKCWAERWMAFSE